MRQWNQKTGSTQARPLTVIPVGRKEVRGESSGNVE